MGLCVFIPAGVKIKKTVNAGQTLLIPIIKTTTFETVKLLVNFKVDNKITAYELLLSNIENDVEDAISGKLGDNLQILTNIIISGSDVVMSVTNNETSVCNVTILQLN